jgi:hypothetical protein
MTTISEDELQAIYQMLGRFMLLFARIEMSLTHATIVIFEHAGGQRGKWKKFPKHMKQQKDFLEESFAELATLAEYRPTWRSIRSDLKRPEEIRHGIVHGVWDGKVAQPGDQLNFRRMAHDGSPDIEILSTDVRELADVDDAVFNLARRTDELGHRLDKAFVPQ